MRIACWLIGAALLMAAGASRGGEMKAELDAVADNKILDARFARSGFEPLKSVSRDAHWVRFRMPANATEQTSLYSYFALAGDFEISVNYEQIAVAAPKKGYGASWGIATDVDAGKDSIIVSLARGFRSDGSTGYLVTRGVHSEEGRMHFKTDVYPTTAKRGVLMMRREKDRIICLAANDLKSDVEELCKVPFSARTVNKVRLFADTGGSGTGLDARLGNLKIRAEEITGGIPQRDQAGSGWLMYLVLVLLIGTGGYLYYRRKTRID